MTGLLGNTWLGAPTLHFTIMPFPEAFREGGRVFFEALGLRRRLDRLQQQLNQAQNNADRRRQLLNQAAGQVSRLQRQVQQYRTRSHNYRWAARHFARRKTEHRTFCLKNSKWWDLWDFGSIERALKAAEGQYNNTHRSSRVGYIRVKFSEIQESQKVWNDNHHDKQDYSFATAYITIYHIYHRARVFTRAQWKRAIQEYLWELQNNQRLWYLADDMS